MHAYFNPIFAQKNTDEDHSLVWALIVSMLLHISIAYIYPHFKSHEVLPQRTSIEVRLSQPTPESTSEANPVVAETVPPEQVKPVNETPPKVTEKHAILSTPSPMADDRYQVPVPTEQKTEALPPSETNAAPVSNDVPATHAAAEIATAHPSTEQAANAHEQSQQKPAEVVSADEAWDGYGKALAAMVNKMKQYPTIAVRRHQEGEVKVIASFKRGKLVSVELVQFSQHEALNTEALRTIKKAIEQVALNTSLEGKTFAVTIPVIFALE